jgi:sortase A
MVRSPFRAMSRLSLVLVVVGLAILTYVGFEYYTMYSSQRQLAKQWQQQQERAKQRGVVPAVATTQSPDDGLTRLSIPKINFAAVVVEGTGRKQLLLGPGHVKDSAAPGADGNAVITGHRDTFFRHIYELNKGDVLTVERDGKTYTYKVTGKKVTDPSDLSVLKQTDKAQLTLITCYPTYYIGPAPERLVVFSKRIDSGQEEAKVGAAAGQD